MIEVRECWSGLFSSRQQTSFGKNPEKLTAQTGGKGHPAKRFQPVVLTYLCVKGSYAKKRFYRLDLFTGCLFLRRS
ncbi:hypothetical protein SAMN05216524_102459 [Mucilaginibacter sp. OK098]|nr:hypothetical protein SAMN05216524_102459 [Mucilaginibacter sp. OK098]